MFKKTTSVRAHALQVVHRSSSACFRLAGGITFHPLPLAETSTLRYNIYFNMPIHFYSVFIHT